MKLQTENAALLDKVDDLKNRSHKAFPHNKEFSYFSLFRHSYSRKDLFFIDKTLFPSGKKTEYPAIVQSDLTPLLLDLSFSPNNTEHPPWRMNGTLQADKSFYAMLSSSIDNFLETNKSDSISPSVL